MKIFFVLISFFSLLMFTGLVSAACNLEVSLLNQDPYPATQGDYVKLVFQVRGLQDPSCGGVYFQLVDKYPLSFDPGVNSKIQIKGGTFTQDYSSYLQVPYKVRIDPDAIDGDNEIEIRYGSSLSGIEYQSKKFNINVQDAKTNFEIFLQDYDPNTEKMTLEVLNTGKKDVEALTLEIKDGTNSILKGSPVNVIGSLNSNDFTTADFDISLSNGNLALEIRYTDEAGIRRITNKTIFVDVQPFIQKAESQKNNFSFWNIAIGGVLLIVIYYFYRMHKNRKKHHENTSSHHHK